MAKASKYVSGTQQMVNELLMRRNRVLANAGEAVEMTCVDVMNHAKAGHDGNMAHANQRYRNRTGNLTAGIGPPELMEVTFKKVHGIVPSTMEYSVFVELGTAINVRTGRPNRPYPFMQPALMANRESHANRLKGLMR
jgi:hypothetical protein